jgi:hypothetical protein
MLRVPVDRMYVAGLSHPVVRGAVAALARALHMDRVLLYIETIPIHKPHRLFSHLSFTTPGA